MHPTRGPLLVPDVDLAQVEALRASEYGRLDAQGHVYLDYAGAGLYAESQVRSHADGARPTADALRRRHAFGAVRASLGIATTPADLAQFVAFVRGFCDCSSPAVEPADHGMLVAAPGGGQQRRSHRIAQMLGARLRGLPQP